MTLLVLAIAAAAMTDLARRSLGRALEANLAEQALQQKWAATSCRHTLLPRADSVLTAAEQRARRPAATLRIDLALGDGPSFTPVMLLFGDEDAKLNANTLYERDRGSLRAALSGFAGPLRIDPRPTPKPKSELAAPALAFDGFGQLFDDPPPAALAAAAQDVTLWGGDPLNFRRASPAVLATALKSELGRGEVGRLVALRDTPAGATLAGLLDVLALPPRDRGRVEPRLSAESTTFSLWVVAGPPNRQRFRLGVFENTVERGIRTIDFAW